MAIWLAAIVVAAIAVWILAPRPRIDATPRPVEIGPDLDAVFAAAEAPYDITPGAEARVVWHDTPGAVTDLAVVYLHGFSATSAEIAPVPQDVARRLGANLILTRLAGHGRDGAAMAEPEATDWIADLDTALAAGRRAGRQVLVIGTSTGGTLAAMVGASDVRARDVAGVVLISPNFRIRASGADLLTRPFARTWLPWILGAERGFTPVNDAQARYWTTRYPSRAVVPLAELVAHARAMDLSAARVPALVLYAPDDRVVDAAAALARAADWGGPVTRQAIEVPPGNDPDHHVLGGDILSPDLTRPVADRIVAWVETL